MAKTTSQVLRDAANRLKTKGWKRGNYGGADGPNCALGAIRWEVSEDEGMVGELNPIVQAAASYLATVLKSEWNGVYPTDAVVDVNDHGRMDDLNMIVAMEIAADLAE